MKSNALPTPASIMLGLSLMVLTIILPVTQTASAQMHEACPQTPGVTPIADPQVTAQQVQAGTASLMDFAREASGQFKQVSQQSVSQAYYFACLIRQDGGPWQSGSTYLVQLTLDGRIFVHTRDMTLSGRRLNRAILAEILTSLDVDPADLTNPQAVLRTLLDEPHAEFDATAPVGQRPGIPGAKGYASVYKTARRPDPIILLAGFDLRRAHTEQEQIDYGDPAVTAADVVDRESLKEFVFEAATYFGEARRAEGRVGVSKAKIAMRDPNGPWRHGSVYLYVLDLTTNIILIHGAFPDRYELRPLVPTVRDAVTGELVLPQVLAAAASSPEGGFVEYYFDDPSDASDSADIPKVGYARQFEFQPTGMGPPSRIVIGSGFYLSDPGVVAARQNLAIEDVLPQVMRAMTASTVDAVSSRIEQAHSGTPPAQGYSLAGASSLYDALMNNGRSLGAGSFNPAHMLANSSFVLPLAGAGGGTSQSTLWGTGGYRDFDGGDSDSLRYDGDVISANLGWDTRLSTDLLAGVSLQWAQGSVDYTDSSNVDGKSKTTLTSINPYVGWQGAGDLTLWATAGYGWGEIEINDSAVDEEDSDLTQQMVAAGVSGPLMASADGSMSLRLKAETAFTWADVDGSGTLESMDLNANRQRLLIEGSHVKQLASGATFTPALELGVRRDGGDGDTGSSIETGASMRYFNPESGLTVEGRAHTLLNHSDDYDEWGLSALVRLDPGTSGLGLALSIRPVIGPTTAGAQQLWKSNVAEALESTRAAREHLNTRIAYGMVANGWNGLQGVLTPYTDLSVDGEGGRRLSLGGSFDVGTALRMSLEGVHDRPVIGAVSHSVMLQGTLSW
ncbi:MAG: autotransporter domain-containing protein [Gammaproteobacteria bacterium]|nr:autotransporter domain-containing protein [Gammaproteobacteria bacterium]